MTAFVGPAPVPLGAGHGLVGPGGWLLRALVPLAALELLLLRVGTRTLLHVPGRDRIDTLVDLLAEAGRLAYYLAAILVVGFLVATMVHAAGQGSRSMAVGIGLFLVAAAAARLGLLDALGLAVATLVAVLMVVATVVAVLDRRRLPVAAWTVAFGLAGLHAVGQLAADRGVTALPDPSMLLTGAEIAGVCGVLSAPLLLPRQRPRMLWYGVAAGLLALGALQAAGPTMRILMLWNVGLSGWLPDPVYALGAASLGYTLAAAVASRWFLRAAAVVLLLCGGIGLHSTYQSAVVLAALTLLARPLRGPGCRARGVAHQSYRGHVERGRTHADAQVVGTDQQAGVQPA